jgi:hypothetical protein
MAYMGSYADFEIWIGTPLPGVANASALPVQVISSPTGPAQGQLSLDLQDAAFLTDLAKVRGIDPDQELRKSFGKRLFDAIFHGAVLNEWNRSLGHVQAGGADGLRLRLRIDTPELALLPWELVWSEKFLATSGDTVLSRYLPVPEPPSFTAQKPLRILIVAESPQGVPPIDSQEVDKLQAAVTSLGARATHLVLRNATTAQIQNALQQDFHVLHYLGHGNSRNLFLTGDDGKKAPIDDQGFSQLFLGRRSLRLVVLNACSSAQSEAGGNFAGIGPALVQKGVPAVIAMQYPFVQVETARIFNERFYGSLANGLAVDVAVNQARQFLSGQMLADRDWSTPVLYMGTRSGQILKFVDDQADDVDRAWVSVQAVTQQDAAAEAALQSLATTFKEVSAQNENVAELMSFANNLREVRTEFAPCVAATEEIALGNMLKLNDLRQSWETVRLNSLTQLQVFVGNLRDVPAWFQPLQAEADGIDNGLAQMALVALAASVARFNQKLAQAESKLRLELSQAVDALVVLSNKTLGRMRLD